MSHAVNINGTVNHNVQYFFPIAKACNFVTKFVLLCSTSNNNMTELEDN